VDRRRRVLLISPTLGAGGAERAIVTLLKNLDRSQFVLTLAVLDMRGEVFRDELPEDVKILDLGCHRVRNALPKLALLIWRQRPDVVWSNLGHLNLALAMIRPLLPRRVRFIGSEHTVASEALRSYPLPGVWRWAYRHFYPRFDSVACPSQNIRNDLVDNFNCPAAKAVVIHKPVDIPRIRRLAAEPLPKETAYETGNQAQSLIHLVAAGRLAPEKGYDLLIQALALCADPRLRLTILGEGPLRASLEHLARQYDVEGQVSFVGFQKNPYQFFARAHAFVLSSRFEGFPNVVLEALACGVPVIATPAPGGLREILDGVTGCILAESVSAPALAAAIKQWLEGGTSRVSGDAVARFSLANAIGRYELYLSEVCAPTAVT
jgi:glycosyltransferase involved in cell wall biosynthesis